MAKVVKLTYGNINIDVEGKNIDPDSEPDSLLWLLDPRIFIRVKQANTATCHILTLFDLYMEKSTSNSMYSKSKRINLVFTMSIKVKRTAQTATGM